mgnify:CR=1 FL=1
MKYKLLPHLERQAREREINLKIIKDTITNQQQIVPEPKGLKIAQSKYYDKEKNKDYLIRIIFREEKDLRIGVTVYKTSKIKKYWKEKEI